MNLRSPMLSAFSLLSLLLVLVSPVNALKLVSRQMNVVNVSLVASEKQEIIKGKIWNGDTPLLEGKLLKVKILDENRSILKEYEKEIADENSKDDAKSFEEDFEFDMTGTKLVGNYTVQASVLNSENQVIAHGTSDKQFKINEEIINEPSKIYGLEFKVDERTVTGGVKFFNNGEEGSYFAKIDTYLDDDKDTYVGTFSSDSVSVKNGEEATILFSFDRPTNPQLYNSKVYVMSGEEVVTGKAEKSFLVKGEFAEFYSLKVENPRYFESGDSITVYFEGSSTTPKEEALSLELNVEGDKGFTEQKFVNLSLEEGLNKFSGREMFLAKEETEQLSVKAVLWKGNRELANKNIQTAVYQKPEEISFMNRIKEIQSGEKLTNSDKYKIVGALILIILSIILFIRGLVRADKGKKFFVFFGLLLMGGVSSVYANYPTAHFYPMDGMFFNSRTDLVEPFAQFNKIGFEGYLSDETLGGLFPTTEENVNYELKFIDLEGNEAASASGVFKNESSISYKFIADIPSSISDGTYSLELVFSGAAIANRLADLSLEGPDIELTFADSNIEIDSKNPTSNIFFEKRGELINSDRFVNSDYFINPDCNDISGCYPQNTTPYEVSGNFCEGEDFCPSKTHKFQFCDGAGNCEVRSANIKFYDPVAPNFEGDSFLTEFSGFVSEVSSDFARVFGINASDSNSGFSSTNGYVCEGSADFYHDEPNSLCSQKQIPIRINPFVNGFLIKGIVTPNCPAGYTYDVDTEKCERNCYYDRFPYCFNMVIDN